MVKRQKYLFVIRYSVSTEFDEIGKKKENIGQVSCTEGFV